MSQPPEADEFMMRMVLMPLTLPEPSSTNSSDMMQYSRGSLPVCSATSVWP